ncbi:hypothetical protein V6Z12_A09G235300 [Gossypium hirsutum]
MMHVQKYWAKRGLPKIRRPVLGPVQKTKQISEEACSKQNPCQELDGICKDKNWVLPTYQVFHQMVISSQGTVKGMNFESSSLGDACPKPHEARGSAATTMLPSCLTMSSG